MGSSLAPVDCKEKKPLYLCEGIWEGGVERLYIIDKVTQILVIILIILIVGFVTVGVWFIWMKRKRKNTKMSDAGIDYQGLERRNSLDYVKLEDIRDDMILTENNTRFIAVIRCQGFDFYYGHVAEQYAAQNGYRGFMNTISRPITYRQYTKAVDLEHTQQNYVAAYKELRELLFNLCEDYKTAKKRLQEREAELEENGDEKEKMDGNVEMEYMLDHLISMQREMEALEWRLLHVKDQLVYLGQLSEKSGSPISMETYVIDWSYNPMEYPVELAQEEIIAKAREELKNLSRQKIHALSTAGVKAYRCTTEELIDMVRRHFQPISTDEYKMHDVQSSSYYDDIASMEGKDDLKKICDEEFTMDIIRAISQEFENGMERMTDMQNLNFEMSEKGAGNGAG